MYNEVQSIRTKVTNRIIIISVIFLTPAYFASMARWIEIGWKDFYIVHTILYFGLISLLFLRKRLSTRIKVNALGFLYTALGLSTLWYLGFSGMHYFVIIAIAMAAILSKRKIAVVFIAFISIGYVTIGILYMTHRHSARVDLNDFSHSILQWTTIILSLIAFAAIFTDGFGELYNQLITTIEENAKVKDTLEEKNKKLTESKAELDKKIEEVHSINLQLQLSEEKYRNLVNFSPNVIYWYSTKNGVLFFSERIVEVLGYTPAEMENNMMQWRSVIHIQDLRTYDDNLAKTKLNETKTQEYRVQNKAGEWIWVSDTYVAVKVNQEETVIEGYLSDITEKRKIEKQLQESERRWQFSVDGSDLGLWDWNINTNEVFYSKQWKNMLGFRDNEFENHYSEWEKRIYPEDKPLVIEKLQKTLKGVIQNFVSEHRMLCKDGNYKWILDRGKIVSYNEDGSPKRMIGTHADITKSKLAELELRRLNATKDKFFSIIAHDLKSPFNSMIGISEILKERYDELDEATKKKFVWAINEGVLKTYDLLEDLLLWSRSQRNTIDFYPADQKLEDLLDELLEIQKIAAAQKEIDITTEVEKGMVVYADKFMLSSILRNLISNAIKFTPRKGSITIKTENTKVDGQMVSKVSVKDTGMGIPPEDHVKIFDIGQNISTIGTENEKGTGMGLPICYEFVNKHGGKIWVESIPEEGATFCFTLPKQTSY